MIFVTVGSQMPFDRLVRAVDNWAGRTGRTDVFAQIGPRGHQPRNCQHENLLDPARFKAVLREASLVVAHAGMGSIITALEHGKPILVMPRRGDLAETRNDHQVATAKRFREIGAVLVAMDENELLSRLDVLVDQGLPTDTLPAHKRHPADAPLTEENTGDSPYLNTVAYANLLHGLRSFLSGQPVQIPAPQAPTTSPDHPETGTEASSHRASTEPA